MFAILASAVNLALGFLVRGVIVKFGVMFAAWYLALDAMAAFPPMLWYMLELVRVDFGIPLMLSAMSTRFLIRRIPFIG